MDNLKNAEYRSTFSSNRRVILTNGIYREKIFPHSATELVVTLGDKMVFGDLNGDGEEDAALILITNSGGGGTFRHPAVVINQNGAPNNVATQLLGDRVRVKTILIRPGEITVEMITRGPSDPMCCPTLEAIQDYFLQGDQLVLAPVQGLIGRKYVLLSFGTIGSEKRLLPDTEISIEFDSDGRLHGSGGCNRYFGAYEIGPGGSLTIKKIGATRMACPQDIMDQEMTYFRALQDVSEFKVKKQVLQLFYDSVDRVLRFNEAIPR